MLEVVRGTVPKALQTTSMANMFTVLLFYRSISSFLALIFCTCSIDILVILWIFNACYMRVFVIRSLRDSLVFLFAIIPFELSFSCILAALYSTLCINSHHRVLMLQSTIISFQVISSAPE